MSRDPSAAGAELAELREAVASQGWRWTGTASGVAVQALRAHLPRLTGLPSRWRGLAEEAVHGGCCVITGARGRKHRRPRPVPWAIQLDRRQAFLAGLHAARGPMRGDGWYGMGGARWARVRHLVDRGGAVIVAADVSVSGACDPPPLPVHSAGAAVYGTGRFVGAWPAEWLAWAEDTGLATVHAIVDAMSGPDDRPTRALAEALSKVEPKALRRQLYTRAWGVLGSRRAHHTVWSTDDADPVLLWRRDREDLSAPLPPWYRPDLAASVAGHNGRAVADLVSQVPPGRVLAVHVDAVWLAPFPGLSKLVHNHADGWKVEGTGPWTAWAPGVYVHGDDAGHPRRARKVKASGYPAWPPPTPEDVDAWGRAMAPLWTGRDGRSRGLPPDLDGAGMAWVPTWAGGASVRGWWPRGDAAPGTAHVLPGQLSAVPWPYPTPEDVDAWGRAILSAVPWPYTGAEFTDD